MQREDACKPDAALLTAGKLVRIEIEMRPAAVRPAPMISRIRAVRSLALSAV